MSKANIIGFSLSGAVALEMAAQTPAKVPRRPRINSMATYRPDHWRKWLETHGSATLLPEARWVRDTPLRAQALSLTGSIAEEHAMGAAPRSILAPS